MACGAALTGLVNSFARVTQGGCPTAVEIRKGTWFAAGQSQLRRSGIVVETGGLTRAPSPKASLPREPALPCSTRLPKLKPQITRMTRMPKPFCPYGPVSSCPDWSEQKSLSIRAIRAICGSLFRLSS